MSATEAFVEDLVGAASAFAREAGALTLEHFGSPLPHENKADGTPVTRADREAEALLRSRIEARWPEHGILGEEYGGERDEAEIRWILDPIDGTRSFMRGVPLYAVLIGIEMDGEAVVGVAHFPALGETVAAGRGMGCRWNGKPCQVSSVTRLEEALLLTTDAGGFAGRSDQPGWSRLCERTQFSRTWGDAYGHALVATGRAEIMIDPELSAWDAGPLPTILTEAGGVFTDLNGAATIYGGSGLSANRSLHGQALWALGE